MLSILLAGISCAWKFLRFTGAWISFLLSFLIDDLLLGKVFQLHLTFQNYPTIFPIYEAGMIVLMCVPIVLTLAYRVYRFLHPKKRTPAPVPQAPENREADEEKNRELQALVNEFSRRRAEEKR